jgi:hypothetical protein
MVHSQDVYKKVGSPEAAGSSSSDDGAAIRHAPSDQPLDRGRSDHMIGSERACPGVTAFDLQRRVLDAELLVQ